MGSTSLITYRYRVKGSAAITRLRRMAIEVNQVWNYCGEITDAARRLNRRWASEFDLKHLTAGIGALVGLHSGVVGETCRVFARSRQKAKRRPRWRVSHGAKRSLGWVPFRNGVLTIRNDSAVMLGERYRLWLSRPVSGTPRSGSFSEDAQGRWFLNVTCEIENADPKSGAEVGIDLGLKDLVVTSDGVRVGAPQHARKLAGRLARAQRAGRKRLTRKIHRKVANQRKDFLHKLSTALVREHGLIVVGNVNAVFLAKTGMAKSVLDAGWRTFAAQLRYKAIMHGARYVEADERWSTQICSCCGAIGGPRGREGLRVRAWRCGHCGSDHDRDINAARNILRSGRSVALQDTEASTRAKH